MLRSGLPALTLVGALCTVFPVKAAEVTVPVLVPITGFLALEGASQRNGALLAVEEAPAGVRVNAPVVDTATTPETAVTALERIAGEKRVGAIVASMLGTQMMAMMPLAKDYGLPLLTISGTATITEQGNPWVFRFFPSDVVTKHAHARYAVEELGAKRAAIIYQTTAYGQSGQEHLRRALEDFGAEVVFEEGVDTATRDLTPVLLKAKAAKPDVLLLHLHAPSTALLIRQAAASGWETPIVAGSALHQPSTAELLEPSELKGVCAETASSPVSRDTPAMTKFADAYKARFNTEPDAFAAAQYDAVKMLLRAVAARATTPKAVREVLANTSYNGVAMQYRSDGNGNMAHSAMIVCYDGTSRVPQIVQRYDSH